MQICEDSLTVERPIQSGGGGSSPTSSLQSFVVSLVDRRTIASFVERHHYSHNVNGVTSQWCFGLYRGSELIGAAIFGQPGTAGVAESYSENGTLVVTELRRLVCVDDTPKNTESFFIGYMMRWLRKHSIVDLVLAYSDLTYGHSGVVYRASNFKLVGQSPAIPKISWNGKLYHDRSMRVRYKGELKPFSVRLKAAVESGEATWTSTKPKNIYIYRIERNR